MRKDRTLPCPQARRLGPGQEMGGQKTMLKKTLIAFTIPLLVLLGSQAAASARATAAKVQLKQNATESQPARRSLDEGGTGTLQKMIVENGTVTLNLDLNQLNGIS